MSSIRGTYLIEFYNGQQIVCGNNYKTWDTHAYEYARWKFREDYTPLGRIVTHVQFSDTPFVDNGGLKYATPEAYQEIIDEMTAKDGKIRVPFKDIVFYFSNNDKKKLNRRFIS